MTAGNETGSLENGASWRVSAARTRQWINNLPQYGRVRDG